MCGGALRCVCVCMCVNVLARPMLPFCMYCGSHVRAYGAAVTNTSAATARTTAIATGLPFCHTYTLAAALAMLW